MDLREDLRRIGEDVTDPPRLPGDLWQRGVRRHRRRQAASVIAVTAVLAGLLAIVVPPAPPPVPPVADRGAALTLPDRLPETLVGMPSPGRLDSGPFSVVYVPLVKGLFVGAEQPVVAVRPDGRLLALDLPDYQPGEVERDLVLSADGRWLAWWSRSEVEAGRPKLPYDGVKLLDTTTGAVRLWAIRTAHGILPRPLHFLNDTNRFGAPALLIQVDSISSWKGEDNLETSPLASRLWPTSEQQPLTLPDRGPLVPGPYDGVASLDGGALRWRTLTDPPRSREIRLRGVEVESVTVDGRGRAYALAPPIETFQGDITRPAVGEVRDGAVTLRVLEGRESVRDLLGWRDDDHLVAGFPDLVSIDVRDGSERVLAAEWSEEAAVAADALRGPLVAVDLPTDPVAVGIRRAALPVTLALLGGIALLVARRHRAELRFRSRRRAFLAARRRRAD